MVTVLLGAWDSNLSPPPFRNIIIFGAQEKILKLIKLWNLLWKICLPQLYILNIPKIYYIILDIVNSGKLKYL